jgi:hypothetical protein
MIEVKSVISGEFEPQNLFEVLQASVVMQDMQDEVNKGKSNVYGWVLMFARNIYGEVKQASAGINDPSTTWQELAAARFMQEAQAAITAGEVAYTKKQLDGFKNAVRTIHYAMEAGADMFEKDQGSGAYVLGGKTQLEQWNKKHRAKVEQEKQDARIAAGRAAGILPQPVPKVGVSEPEAETENGDNMLDLITEPKVRAAMESYILLVVDGLKDGATVADVTNQIEANARHLGNHIRNSIAKNVAALKKAAAG